MRMVISSSLRINLSPIAARYCELLELSDAADFEASRCKRLSNMRTVLRRGIAAIIESEQNWDRLIKSEFATLHALTAYVSGVRRDRWN